MNMKKKIGICVTLLTALLSVVPQSAQASGKIRSVDVYDPSGLHTFPNHDGHDSPLTVGDTVYIRFRLANLEWGRTETDPYTYTNPWRLVYTGSWPGIDDPDFVQKVAEIAEAKPRLGLWVSGSLREAECVSTFGVASDWLNTEEDGGAYLQGKHYTDLIFKYTVQAGDIALPLQLANASGTGPATGSEGYYFKYERQDTLWKIQTSKEATTVTADFAFGEANLGDDPDFAGDNISSWLSVSDKEKENRDLDLYKAGAYIQAIDFDKTYFKESEQVWRLIAQGSITADPGAPMVEIAGGAAEPLELYLWTTNDVAEIVTGGQVYEVSDYDFGGGVTHKVGKLRITAGSENVPFSIKATGSVGDTAEIFLAATPTNIFNASGDLITNFIARTIQVGEPLPPSINVTVNGKASETVTASADYRTAQVRVNVTLSEPYTGDIDVPIKVTLRNNALGLDPTNYVGLSETSLNDNTSWDTVLQVRGGQTTADLSLWMYANRGSMDTEAGLLFEVNTNDASWVASPARGFFTGKFTGATVVINRSTPEIVEMPTLPPLEANAPTSVRIKIADAFGELRDPCRYTVYWSRTGGTAPEQYQKIENVAATLSGELVFPVTYPEMGDYESSFYVVNQDGGESLRDNKVTVHVKAAKVIVATPYSSSGRFAESDEPQPVVSLSFGEDGFKMPDDSEWGYVFFVPRNETSSNLVSFAEVYDDWGVGLPVFRGQKQTDIPIQMTLLDGDTNGGRSMNGTRMEYDIIVRTAERIDQGDLVTSWSSRGFSFIVTNVAPNVTGVTMGSETLDVNGGNIGNVSLGVTKAFSADTDEPSGIDYYADDPDYTDQSTAFQTRWNFKLGTATLFTTNIFGPPSIPFNYTFRQEGTYTIEVMMRDKDSVDRVRNKDKFGPKFTFTLKVDAKPAVSLAPHFGTTAFTESSGGSGENALSRIDVNLSTLPTEQIAVQLTIERAGPDNGNYPLPELSTTTLSFGGESANTTNAWFTLRNLDGTDRTLDPGFVIRAAVTNTTVNGDSVPWRDVYRSTELPITIQNLAPEVTRPASNTVTRAINEPFTINYTFKDFGSYDMYNNGVKGETLYWTITGEPSVEQTITPNANTYRGTFTTQFSSAGTKTIQLQVVDKDGGESEVATWYYRVDAAKQLLVTPCGPGNSSGGNLASKWMGRNRGEGRVWANGAIKPFDNFTHIYTYAPSIASALAYAHGYSAGSVDNGSLTPGTDYAITKGGRYPATGNHYTADAEKDSFFYAWLLSTGEEGKSLTTELLKLAPAYGADSNSQQAAPLPKEEKDATYYPDTILDAVFAREFLVSDNLGDINGDQIPDIYAVNPIWDGGKRLFAVAGYTSEEAGDVEFNASTFNDDLDYLPSASFEGGLPSTADGWTTLGEPFTAYWEIRGAHEGLNHRANHDGLNLYVRGDWVSIPHFSEAETNAVAYWNLGPTNTWAYFKANAPTNEAEYAAAYTTWSNNFWTALMKNDSWIPENRSDPTLWDTDGDGLPDGYEYYFWYRAAVGRMVGTNWVQMTGEKFTLNNIAKGEKLTPEDIVAAFNPTKRATGSIATRDTDNDGLTDLEEFYMGTNPVHWDSDGDGMSDFWEVLRGMNPLKRPTEAERNADGDFMAAHTTEKSYAIVTLNNGKVYAIPQNGTNLKQFEVASFDADDGTTSGGTNVLSSVVFGLEDPDQNVSNVTAIAVFHYGDDSSTCVPKKRSAKPLDPAEVNLADTEVVSVKRNQSLLLVHEQVYRQFDFHPYTGWYVNADGNVSARWGAAVNTVPYNAVDEYRLLKYRYETGIRSAADDISKIASKELTLNDVFMQGTTNPNKPFSEAAFTVYDATEQSATTTYSSTNHGADTDEDGIPDGWELYVGANPNNADDANGGANDDGLNLRNEYAGSDSCNAYQFATNGNGVATIYQYHPGVTKGWYNKFTPTDPESSDTDGDGVSDGAEGGSTFIYGMTGDPATDDDGTRCIRGGGLNPCGVDTDFDLLPDAWELQYHGTKITPDVDFNTLSRTIIRNDNLASNSITRAYITAGMDGTFNDARTTEAIDPFTKTHRNLDFDNDGLQNFQEYLVQTLRHLRYDDTETPLMGSYLPDGIAGTRKYIGFLPMQVWDGATFFRTARDAGFTGVSARQGEGFLYDKLGYFAPPKKEWDLTMSGSRILMPPRGLSNLATASDDARLSASRYVGTDPREWDTDQDGMDDYYELFHGLNPLLGGVDVISDAYNTKLTENGPIFSARCNAWTGWAEQDYVYDAMMYPWAMGMAEADADGDGLRNTDEALLVNMPNPKNYHTDPTPLWMTDSSSKISFTAQYYRRDPYKTGTGDDGPNLSSYFWFNKDLGGIDGRDPGGATDFMFTFEENEGYDSDHDWIPDEQELTHAVTGATSPLNASDPDRRQAMYFPGTESVVASYSDKLHRRADPTYAENYAMLRAFTVEAWVRPEDLSREQTILTRVCDYPASTLSNAAHQVRANFRIAMEAGGRVYGQYDSDDAVKSGSPKGFGTTTVEGITLASNTWSHVALSFDGNALVLYVNGREVNRVYSNLIPANGLVVTLQSVSPGSAVTPPSANFGVDGYTNYPSALLIGADAAELGAMTIGPDSAWTNYCDHYMGWVDEVRVWDGARTQEQIASDFTKRYTLKDVSVLRDAVYKEWLKGGTHNPNDGHSDLPTELVFHYGFQQLPSEIVADYVASEPSGFTERILNNVKWNGHSVDIRCGWWNAVPIASTVYQNRAIVPWLRDTCGMLPALDGSTYDSRYWSELVGGTTFPGEVNVAKFMFPNVANPYPYWTYMADSYYRELSLRWMRSTVGSAAEDAWKRFRFDNRTLFVGGSDLLPLGGAFVKRCPDFWDGNGATDASTITADDTDNDGLPDWWEAHAATAYGADAATLTTKTKVNYTLPSGAVVEMSAWEAYQIDLARGIMPGLPATYDPAYESLADNNNDGLPDWWQKLYDVYDLDPDDDPDNDGLSIYQEWQISWDEANGFGVLNGYPFLSPTKARSGDAQEVTDYFLKSTTAPYEGYYMGEIVADFDMMEDGFEDAFGTDDTLFDAWSDYDEDGWSAWSELRYSTFKMSKAGQFVSHNVGDTEVVDSPEPVIHATLRYNGDKNVGSTNATFIVQAFAGNNMLKAPTATYVVKPGTSETRYYYLGMQENRVIHGTFTPGFLQAQKGSFSLEYAYIQPSSSYSWRVTLDDVSNDYTGTYEELREAITRYGASLQLAVANFTWTPVNGGVAGTDGSTEALRVDVDDNTQKGYMSIDMERVGEIDFTTGDFTFDLSKLSGKFFNPSAIASENCFYRIKYNIKLPTMQNKKLSLSLGKPTTGALVEGSTAFEAFIDLDGNGAFTPGVEPYGFVKNVDVGWDNVPELVIEMTDESAAAGKRFAYNVDTNVVRIIRTAINGKETLDNGTPVKRRIVYNRDVTSTDRTTVHEGDLVTAGRFGLDWANLRADVEAMDGLTLKDVSSVTYTVTSGNGSVMNIDPTNVLDTFTVAFPAEQSKPTAVSPSPLAGPKVETQRPTFKWTGTEDNTAFILQILNTDDTPVYTSPLQVLPARDATGAYVWTAPVYVSTNASADAWSLGNNSNYNWRVAMFSPKFSNTNLETAVWSDVATFTNCLAEGGSRTSAYGAADVQVRYFGPATNDLTNVVVQLFKTADFTGEPAAQSRLEKVDGTVTNLVETGYGVRFLGLAEGTYYAIAYIDRNGDCVRQRSESWGYANRIGTGVVDLYTPVEVKIVSKSGTVPSVELFMEDTDVNQNGVPDCLDDEALLTAASAAAGADTTDVDGDGLTADTENGETYTSASLWDTDGDGMPDGWEAMFAGTDPLTADADTVIDGDVMAYVEETWKLVTDAAGTTYLVNPTNKAVRVGDDLPLACLVSTYDYAGKYGVGTNLTDTATTFRVAKIENVTAVRVHAQVYDKYGYNPLTAVPVDDAVNTKPFTALDKYLLVRYFEALGLCTEADVNAAGDWISFSLMPNDADNDRDGVLDGWELYTMFGPEGAQSVATLADAKISPFNYDDARTIAPATGSALTVLEEFDGGNSPTDPWQTTTEGFTGLPDDIAYKFRIKSDADLLADPDNDGLSNWAEYLASELTGEDFDVTDPCSVTPNRLDYFYQFLNPIDPDGEVKYIGESIDADYFGLIADHDFMEDFVEDMLGYNRYVYDANVDYDGNGWDNWSEVRARYNEATWVVTGIETNTHTRTFNSMTPEAKGQWQMWYDTYWQPKLYNSIWPVSARHYRANGEEVEVNGGSPTTVWPWTDDIFCEVVWYELNEKKAYGGKPLPNVNFTIYGIDASETNVTIAAYTDKNLLTPDATLDRNGKILSGSLKQGLNTFIVTSGAKTGYAKANVGFDRVDVEIALRADAIAFNVEPQTNTTTRVRVQRTAINGTSFAKPRTVYAKTMDLRNGKTFTEADLLKDGEYDFDQTYLVTDAEAAGVAAADIRSVNYAVYLDWGSAEPIYTFTRTFPAKLVAPAPSGATGQHGNVVEAARPTLAWQAPEGAVAFMLEVAKDDAFSDIIYTATNFMPIATAEGCQFKPDLYVGDELEDGKNYFWRVASVDAVTNSDWSAVATFRTAVNVENADTGYGRIAAEVRYFGPSAAVLSNVVVGVYESADFTTEPVARKHLVGGDSVSTLTNDLTKAFDVVSTNIVLDGIAPGNYYLMAFIDTNTNNVRDAWESWGYVNKIGTEAVDLYTPAALKVKSTKAMPPTAFLVMEDTDVNQNWTPDCLEEAALDGWIPASQIEPEEPSAADTDTDGDGLFDSEEDDYGTDPKNPDTDGDGLPDGFEVKVGSDPLFADSDLAGMNDVMAYKLDALKVMVTTNDAGEVTGRYVVNSRIEEGYAQQSNTVYTVFEVNGQLYVGAPTDRVDVTNAYAYAFMTNVVVMHSAVYDFYGYDPTTAKPGTVQTVAGEDGAESEQTVQGANTVPFTAFLKYVTQAFYLKEFDGGAATNDFALTVGKLDSNANYLPDGYELYVRYATWHDPSVSYSDADVRSSYGDNFAQVSYDPYDAYGLWNGLVASGTIGATATNFVSGVANADLVAAIDVYTNDWNYANGVMAYAQTTAHVATNGTDKFVVVIAGADDPDGVAEGAVKTVLDTVTLPNGELVAWGATNAINVAGLPIGEEPVTLVHRAVYYFYGFEPDTARGCINDGAAAAPAAAETDGEDGEQAAAPAAGTGHTAPFTHAWRYFTREIVGYADPVEVVYDFEDGTGNGLADGWELYVGTSDAMAYQYRYDPEDEYYFYNYLTEQDPEFAGSLPPYDNTFAISNGLAGATVEEQKAFWDWAPADDYMAYVQTNVLISVVTNTDGVASIYAIDPGTNTLYETFYVGGELFVGAVCTNEYAYDAMENGDFKTMVTNATVIHSAVYDWYGFDPTTAKPSYFWPESIAYLAESNSNYTVGANSVPFTRRLKYITQTMYLPLVGAEDDYFLTTSWTVNPSTWWTDTNGNDMPDGWELYVKYTASSDPNKPDDDYKGDFDDGSDPNADDTDGDGIPDDVEQFFGVTDPTVKDADTVLENDVMAFANVNATVVTVQNTAEGSLPVKYLLAEEMAGNTVAAPKVGDDAASLALRATYEYLITAEDGSATNVCGVSTNVTLTAADGTTNRVVAVGVEPVVLVHAQVYDYFGFNPNTANTTAYAAGNAENTKLFTALDKYLVVRYLEAYGLAVATNDWKTLSLDPATSDGDADGVPDGWELYVMFGTEGITETIDAAKISPFNFDDARALAPAGDVTVIEKWNNGAPAYDPWSKDTNGNGIPDADEIKNRLDDLYGDADNDQLPNFTEYLIGAGFTNYFDNVAGISATNAYSLTPLVTDYFRRVGKLYLGEMFTDHDFMEDLWEDRFHDVKKITRAYYDPWNDPDNDGWSNYAECRAGTDPTVGNSQGLSGLLVRNYPVPTIRATVVMGPGEGKLSGNLVVQAYSATSDLTGRPDAIWTVGFKSGASSDTNSGTSSGSSSDSSSDDSASEKSSYLGINPGRAFTFTLNPGSVTPGTVSMSFLDPSFEVHSITNDREVVEIGNINNAEWHDLVEDRPDGDMATGVMQVTTPTNSYAIGTIDYRTGQVTVDFAKLPSELRSPADGDLAKTNVVHLGSSYVRASWVASLIAGNTQATLQLGESDSAGLSDLGHVREGTNTFVVFVADGDGVWKPGAPYGVVTGVDVGWSDAEFTVELTRTTPIMARFDLVSALSSGGSGSGGGGSDPTDRGLVNTGRGYAPNKDATYPGTNMPENATSLTRVRVVRNEINDTHVSNDVLLDRYFDLSVHPSLTESDLIAAGYLDLDWKTLNLAYNGRATPHKDLETATYRIVIGDDNTGGYVDQGEFENFGNNLPVLFVNKFEPKAAQTPTVPDPKLAEIVYSSRPTFRWSHTNSIDKAYPAFQLKIFKADRTTVVYDSGVQRAPARDADGMYEWTAPVYADMVTPSGYVFNTTNNYYWSVSMLDAKFTAFNSSEAKTPFRLGTSGNLFDGKEHGSIAVCVKYFGPLVETGPLSASHATRKNLIRVQAFTSPDFSGTPVAEAYVTNVATIASEDVIATNALLRGVVRDGTYYVRAYIDTDANGVKSDWESWGYACWVGDPDVKSVWTPKPVTVSYTDMAPVVTVFIEDADTDNDGFPDAWEMNKNSSLTTQGPISGDTFFAAVNPNLDAALNAYDKVASVFEGSGAENTLRGLPRLRSSSPQWVELLAGSESDLPVETTSVQIKSFSLENGLELEVSNETTAGASNAITFNGSADVQLSLACATKPDFSDAVEVPIKSITIRANDTVVEPVTADELATARANVPEARFFKAIIKKQ